MAEIHIYRYDAGIGEERYEHRIIRIYLKEKEKWIYYQAITMRPY